MTGKKQGKTITIMRKIKTKPFDLEKALKGAPVVTRDGLRAEILGYDPQAEFGVSFTIKHYPFVLTADIYGYWCDTKSGYDLFLLDEETQEGGEK